MTSASPPGATVPASELAASLADAARRAGTGHTTFAYVWDVQVDFTIREGQTDVRVVGLDKDDPDTEFRVVGDVAYSLVKRYAEQDPATWLDGGEGVTTHWLTTDLTSTREEDRFLVQNGRGATHIGTPLGLIEGIETDRDAVVVEADQDGTTYECLIRPVAVYRAMGENPTGEGRPSDEPGLTTRIVVDAAGLPTRIDPEGFEPFVFSDWGAAPEVSPPDAPTTDWLDFEMEGFEGMGPTDG